MAVQPTYKHVSFECVGDGCWHTPDGFFWIFDHVRHGAGLEFIPVSLHVAWRNALAAERHKAARDIQRVWRGTSWRRMKRQEMERSRKRLVSFGDYNVVRGEGDVHQEMKTFDGPNPQSVIFAEMVRSFFAKKWCNEIQLLEQYGSKFVSDNQDTFSVIFQKAMIQMFNGGKWGMWTRGGAVVPRGQNHLKMFFECEEAFRKAMILISVMNVPSNYMCLTPPFCEAKYINVN